MDWKPPSLSQDFSDGVSMVFPWDVTQKYEVSTHKKNEVRRSHEQNNG